VGRRQGAKAREAREDREDRTDLEDRVNPVCARQVKGPCPALAVIADQADLCPCPRARHHRRRFNNAANPPIRGCAIWSMQCSYTT